MAAETSAEWFTIGPASRFLEKSPDTLRNWVRVGKLPATRTATGILLFTRADLEACANRAKGEAA